MVKVDSKKTQTFIAFFEQFLREVKVETLWIYFRFWGFIRPRPLSPLSVMPHFCSKSEVSWRSITVVSFISIAFVVPQLSRFKCFPISQIWHFWELLGTFWAMTPPSAIRFFPNLEHWCRSLFYITYITVFHIVLKFPRKQAQKPAFGAFLEGFWATPCHTL